MTERRRLIRPSKASTLAFLAFLPCGQASAGTPEMLHGLFCNTEMQIDATVALLGPGGTLDAAVAIANSSKVECVLAKDIEFVVEDAVAIGDVDYLGVQFTKYEGSLVGVMVGENLRPVDPPVKTFFVGFELLISAAKQSPI
jgi:hypothetical protein